MNNEQGILNDEGKKGKKRIMNNEQGILNDEVTN
jgi:hypothetical protein